MYKISYSCIIHMNTFTQKFYFIPRLQSLLANKNSLYNSFQTLTVIIDMHIELRANSFYKNKVLVFWG